MIPTDFLFHLAEYEGIKIEWHDFDTLHGLYLSTPAMSSPVIALSNSLNADERLLRCVLSHELGHHFETTGHYIIAANNPNSVYATKNENSATKWAVNLMINTYTYLDLIKDGMDKYQLADYFYVSQEFISLKGESIKDKPKYANAVAELKSSYDVIF